MAMTNARVMLVQHFDYGSMTEHDRSISYPGYMTACDIMKSLEIYPEADLFPRRASQRAKGADLGAGTAIALPLMPIDCCTPVQSPEEYIWHETESPPFRSTATGPKPTMILKHWLGSSPFFHRWRNAPLHLQFEHGGRRRRAVRAREQQAALVEEQVASQDAFRWPFIHGQ
ncbi:uncharacterized protein MCYG_07940 [Microsporum canis CBS 113480]|uniref:Uncharacterized protein n=1 Tax=Arthroderma otae (strain ATCC MYA-4605 / CBS 113480) TaxID=554155 RepID=C5FXT1_ARTOC|nr:uncharacterized protein MCYG_07940 [Microsporum canis CBS 113480]EEQ35121.1 predicted protein [Microsporum canis CBS 113480]